VILEEIIPYYGVLNGSGHCENIICDAVMQLILFLLLPHNGRYQYKSLYPWPCAMGNETRNSKCPSLQHTEKQPEISNVTVLQYTYREHVVDSCDSAESVLMASHAPGVSLSVRGPCQHHQLISSGKIAFNFHTIHARDKDYRLALICLRETGPRSSSRLMLGQVY
jgi:hypothetical protein